MLALLYAFVQVVTGLFAFFAEIELVPGLKHTAYSKFRNASKGLSVSTQTGMLGLYGLPWVISCAFIYASFRPVNGSFLISKNLVPMLWSLHFFKRITEVLFVHSYSGPMELQTAISIGLKYALDVIGTSLFAGINPLSLKTLFLGFFLFGVGELGNGYHHLILANLRKPAGKFIKSDVKEYVVPRGGLFDYLVTPHYFFELTAMAGIMTISQWNAAAIGVFTFMVLYLAGRSFATQKWYVKNVKEWKKVHKERKRMVPFVW
jgi:very-long-chain enoyl-CoA reductase